MPDVRLRVEGKAGRITLARPKALNALTHEMSLAIEEALEAWRNDPAVLLVIVDAEGERAFCAGGDIQSIYRDGKAGNLEAPRRFWADEYRMNAKIAHYPKPLVALMDGIVMGGGVGIGGHASHRILTERSMVAMPECGIGLVPDVGASLILACAPGKLGEYLGLTGFRMGAGEAIQAGFADFFVPVERLTELTRKLVDTGDPAVVSRFAETAPVSRLDEHRAEIDAAFGGDDVPEILRRLEAAGTDWALETAAAIRKGSPISLVATLSIVRAVREDPKIETALAEEYRFTYRSIDRGELLEGIRAAVVDKDRSPRWSPERVEDLSPELVEAVRASLGENELSLGGSA